MCIIIIYNIYIYAHILYIIVCVHKRVQPSNPQITGGLPASQLSQLVIPPLHPHFAALPSRVLELHSTRLPFTSMDTSTPVWLCWMSDPVPFLRSAASAAEHRKIFFFSWGTCITDREL